MVLNNLITSRHHVIDINMITLVINKYDHNIEITLYVRILHFNKRIAEIVKLQRSAGSRESYLFEKIDLLRSTTNVFFLKAHINISYLANFHNFVTLLH
jgi:hypothetical protein